jgi:hypothetical protein
MNHPIITTILTHATRIIAWLKARLWGNQNAAEQFPHREGIDAPPQVPALDLAALKAQIEGDDTVPAPDVVAIGIETVKEALGENGVARHVFTIQTEPVSRDREATCLLPVPGSQQWMRTHSWVADGGCLACTVCGKVWP